ncbi:MAG: methionine--tRNA ligase subunit beta, partial [Planctomycetota bacterium]
TRDWCDRTGEDFQRWWKDPSTEIHHFIGKDIIYFHALFWPAMLRTAGFNLPDRVHIHGFLTVDGDKMSKSKGTFIRANDWQQHLDPAWLRYYYASKLNDTVNDIDLNFDEFIQKVNADLVGKVVNLASRSARFIADRGLSERYPDDEGLFAAGVAQADAIAAAYEATRYSEAMRLIMALADRANEYVERKAPWILKKDPERTGELQDVCTVALNCFRQICVYLAPVLPRLAEDVGRLFGRPIEHWDAHAQHQLDYRLQPFEHLMQRARREQVDAVLAATRDAAADAAAAQEASTPQADDDDALRAEPLAAACSFDDFMRVDLRVARVLAAEAVPKSKKLLKLRVGLGATEERTVLAGIKAAYRPEDLVGRLVLYVANLEPREMGRFGTSHGMIAAAGPGGEDIFLLAPDSGAVPGQRVH